MHFRSTRAFTLLEIVLVVALIGGLSAYLIPRFMGGGQSDLRDAVRRIAIVSRESKQMAKLYGKTFRLVLYVSPEEGSEDPPEDFKAQFWVESAQGSVMEGTKAESFNLDKRIMKKPQVLPEGLVFNSVEFTNKENPITQGKAYVYYLPQGLVTEAVIHLHSGELKWTIAIHPLTGKVDVFNQEKFLKDLQQE